MVGAVNAGGVLPEHWIATIVEAIDAGWMWRAACTSGSARFPPSARRRSEHGAQLHDVRHADRTFATGKGTKRPGKRLLTVGTDCSVGKKYTALALEAEMTRRGFDAEFCATGQTGVLIAGRGVAIDAVGGGLHLRRGRMALAGRRRRTIGRSSRARARCSTPPSPA